MAGEDGTSPAVDLKFYVFEEPLRFYMGLHRVDSGVTSDPECHHRRSKVIVPTGCLR